MARRSLGTLTIDLIAEVGGFVSGMDKSARKAEEWRKKVDQAAKTVGTALGVGIATAVTGLTALTLSTAKQAAEIGKLAQVSGTGVVEFQRFAAGANAFGVQQDKLADIFKDTQDKVGDFLQNGAGPLADFFDNIAPKVGVTAKSFQNLSGPQALQLYATSLQKAKVSQADMVFYMEALASDATMLIPLLRDGGDGFKTFGDAAQDAGAILGEDTVVAGQKMKAVMWLVEQQLSGFRNNLAADILPVLADIGETLLGSSNEARKSVEGYEFVGSVIRMVAQVAAGGVAAFDLLGRAIGGVAATAAQLPNGFDAVKATWSDVTSDLDATANHWGNVIDGFGNAGKAAGAASGQVAKLTELLGQQQQAQAAAANAAENAAERAKRVAEQERLVKAYEGIVLEYDRKIALTSTDAALTAEVTELEKARFEAEKGRFKDYSAGQKAVILGKAEELDKTLQLKKANDDLAKAAEFAANLQESLSTVQSGMDVEVLGAGLGEQARDRARKMLEIEADYQQKRDDLFKRHQSGKITQSLYDTETADLQKALDRRLAMQEDHYRKLDELRGNSMAGMADAWADYATNATDSNQQAYDAVSGFLNTTTGDVASSIQDLVKGNESVFDSVKNLVASMGETVINTLSQMAAQWLVYQATQLLVGKAGAAAGAAGLLGNALATQAQASLAAFASTAAIPLVGPAMAPGAAAAAMAATAPMVAMVSAASLAGMAHDGIDMVPETGTWLLQQGERVTTAATSAKLDATLERVNRDIPAGQSGGDTNHFTFNVAGSISERERMMQRQTVTEAVRLARQDRVADTKSGTGPQSRAMRSRWATDRKKS